MRIFLTMVLVLGLSVSCFAWNDRYEAYGMYNPDTTTEKIIWVAGSLTLAGLGWTTMVNNARDDNASTVTGAIVAYTGIFGLRVALFRW